MVLKRPEKKVTLTFAGFSHLELWVNGMLKLYTIINFSERVHICGLVVWF
jgi:hypothetical protein